MRSAAFVALIGLGCGRSGFDPVRDRDAQLGDATADACTARGPWLLPAKVASPSSPQNDRGPTTSPDGLELAFHSDRDGNNNLYIAKRASKSQPFGMATELAIASSPSSDESPTFSPDGLTLYFSSNRGGGALQLYRTRRSAVGAAWDPVEMVSELSSFGVRGPTLSKRGDELFNATTGATTRLVRSTFNGSTFTTPFVVSELDNGMPAAGPGLSPDGLTLVFEGQRGSAFPILFATRTSIGGMWSTEQVFTEASDSFVSEDPEFSYDGSELYFASTRASGDGTHDLFVMARSCL